MWAFQLWRTVDGLWHTWPANEEVQFVWQTGLTEAAEFLDASSESGPVAIGGWTPDTMDPPTMDLTLRRDDLSLRYFDPTQSLVIPSAAEGEVIRLVRPAILPLAPDLESIAAKWSVPTDSDFALYEVASPVEFEPDVTMDVLFGDEVRLTGFDLVEPCQLGQTQPCELVTYWHVEVPSDDERRFFLHAVDETGQIIAQDDRMGVPTASWQAGDTIIQIFNLPSVAGELRLGIYNPATDQRLPSSIGADYAILQP